MNSEDKKLLIEQLDRKLHELSGLKRLEPPPRGWIHAIRTALNMSLAQLARKLNKTVPTVKEIEQREQENNITLKKLREVADVLDLHLVYGFIPKDASLQKMIERRASEVARAIVMRTSHSMSLEDQENTSERLEKAIRDRAAMLKDEMPKYLWD